MLKLLSSPTFPSLPSDAAVRALEVTQLALLAFVATDTVVSEEVKVDALSVLDGLDKVLAAVADKQSEQVKQSGGGSGGGAGSGQLACVVPLMQYRSSCARAMLHLLSDSHRTDWVGLALAVVQTAASFFGVGTSQAAVLAQAAADAVTKKVQRKVGELLHAPLLNISATLIQVSATPSVEAVRAAMVRHGSVIVDPSSMGMWEEGVTYVEMLHHMLIAVQRAGRPDADECTRLILQGDSPVAGDGAASATASTSKGGGRPRGSYAVGQWIAAGQAQRRCMATRAARGTGVSAHHRRRPPRRSECDDHRCGLGAAISCCSAVHRGEAVGTIRAH
jgi:hypothetical protein